MCVSVWWLLLAFPLSLGHPSKDASAESYAVYSVNPGGPIRVFAYRSGVAALVYESASLGIVVQLQRVDSFERSSPFIAKETAHPHHYRVEACFERDGHSHLLAYDTVLNETLLIRGQKETSLPLRDYDFLRGFSPTMTLESHKSEPELECEITEPFTDLMVVGGQPFAIFDQSVNRQLPNGNWTRMMGTKSSVFWFQLFPVVRQDSPSLLTQISPSSIVIIVEAAVLLFAVYCLNMKLKLRPQSGIYELSRGSAHGHAK
ncbi:hypothetical protein AAVH_34941 [Aphelenchoides avenae]|nr:hypothetical protein AAVH_34941 [Aphelenchus avenae]